MTKEENKLLPCGCGGEQGTYDCSVTGKVYVECDCGMGIWARNKPEARKAWNRAMSRPQPAIEGDVDSEYELVMEENRMLEEECERLNAKLAAMQPAIDKAVAEERARCVEVCQNYEGSENQKIAGTARAIRQSIEQGGGDA